MTLVKRIIYRFYQYEYPSKVRRAFFHWFLQSTHNTEKEEALTELWERTEVEADVSTWQSWTEVSGKLGWSNEVGKQPKGNLWIKRWVQIAAVFVLPLMGGLFTYLFLQQPVQPVMIAEEIRLVECFVGNGELRTVVLPDSSRVTINSGSILLYPEKFTGEERNIYLNGEAYFEVIRKEDAPFIVKTNGVNVEVLGTRFNLSAYSDQHFITTTLEEGSVEVHVEGESIRIEPNEQLSYNRISGQITRTLVDGDHIAAWRQGDLIFLRATMDEIIRTLEHRYNVSMYLNSNYYEGEIITAKFIHGEELDDALSVLKQLIPGFSYQVVESKDGKDIKKKVFIR